MEKKVYKYGCIPGTLYSQDEFPNQVIGQISFERIKAEMALWDDFTIRKQYFEIRITAVVEYRSEVKNSRVGTVYCFEKRFPVGIVLDEVRADYQRLLEMLRQGQVPEEGFERQSLESKDEIIRLLKAC